MYTPTVGDACLNWGVLLPQPLGLYLSIDDDTAGQEGTLLPTSKSLHSQILHLPSLSLAQPTLCIPQSTSGPALPAAPCKCSQQCVLHTELLLIFRPLLTNRSGSRALVPRSA